MITSKRTIAPRPDVRRVSVLDEDGHLLIAVLPNAYKYPARLRKSAVSASFPSPFSGLRMSDSQRWRVWRFTPILQATACSVRPDSSRYRFNALNNSSGLITPFSGNLIPPLPIGRPQSPSLDNFASSRLGRFLSGSLTKSSTRGTTSLF
jgi:hypothetical protein